MQHLQSREKPPDSGRRRREEEGGGGGRRKEEGRGGKRREEGGRRREERGGERKRKESRGDVYLRLFIFCTCDHIFDVVSMSGAINVGVVSVIRLVLYMCC